MDNNQESVEIKITHFINPHMFWFQKTSTKDSNTVKHIEEKINKLYSDDMGFKQSFGLNEIVAVKHLSWDKYVRARIIDIRDFNNLEFKYVLWIMDYGFPFESKNLYIRKLPTEYANVSTQIQFGSIANIMPGFACNLGSMGRSAIESKNWSKSTINSVSQLLKEATFITFAPVNQIFDYQQMGIIKLQLNARRIINLNEYLINNQLGVECKNFNEKIRNSVTNKIEHFMNNDRKYKVVKNIPIESENHSVTKYKNLKEEHTIEPQIRRPVMSEIMNILDEGVKALNVNENAKSPKLTAEAESENCIILDELVDALKYSNVGQMHKFKWMPVPRLPLLESFSFDEYITPEMRKTMDSSYDNNTSHFLNNDNNVQPITVKNNQMVHDSTPKSCKLTVNSSENKQNYITVGNKSLTPESIDRTDQMLKLRTIHRNMYSQKNEVPEVQSKACGGQLPSLILSLPAGFDMRNLHPNRNWESRPKTQFPRKCHDKRIKQK